MGPWDGDPGDGQPGSSHLGEYLSELLRFECPAGYMTPETHVCVLAHHYLCRLGPDDSLQSTLHPLRHVDQRLVRCFVVSVECFATLWSDTTQDRRPGWNIQAGLPIVIRPTTPLPASPVPVPGTATTPIEIRESSAHSTSSSGSPPSRPRKRTRRTAPATDKLDRS